MSDHEALELAKEILEAETLIEDDAVNVDAPNKKRKESPTVDTDSIEDEDLYQVAHSDEGAAEVNEPEADEDEEEENKDSVAAKPSAASEEVMKEHMDALFGGEDLSEDFRTKAEVIFKSALHERTESIRSEMQEEYDALLENETKRISGDLAEKLDDYLNYVVSEWSSENEIAIEHGLKNEIAESFIGDLKTLFETHNINIPDESFDALSDANRKIDVLEDKLNEQLQTNVDMVKTTNILECAIAFMRSTNGLTTTEVETLRNLSEGLEFDNAEQYEEKLGILKENYFNNSMNYDDSSLEEENTLNETVHTTQMGQYLSSLTRISNAENKAL